MRRGRDLSGQEGGRARRGPVTRPRWLWVCLLAVVLLVAVPWPAAAKSYTITQVRIDAVIEADGLMRVHERRTFAFDGSYSWVIQDLVRTGPQTSTQLVNISDIVVSEGDKVFAQAASGDGTYSLQNVNDRIEVTWRFTANSESRTFDLTYTIAYPVVAHADVAELYWKWIGSEWEVTQSDIVVNLTLPAGATRDEVRAWGHGPLAGSVDIVSPTQVTWRTPTLNAGSYLEGRVTFPIALVPDAARRTTQIRLPTVLAEEEKWAGDANWLRWSVIIGMIAGAVLFGGSVLAAVWLQLRYGREFRPEFTGDYYRELPGDYSPAEMGKLWRFGTVGPQEMTATILDLARRRYLAIEVVSEERKVLGGLLGTRQETQYLLKLEDPAQGKGALKAHERALLTFFFDKVGAGQPQVDFDAVKVYAKRNPTGMQAFVRDFTAAVDNAPASDTFFDKRTATVQTWEIVGGVFFFLGGIGLMVLGSPAGGMMAFMGGIVLIIGGATLRRRSQLGSTHLAMWQAFKRFLVHFSSLDRAEVPSLIIWEHYLVYAVVLGVAKEVMDQLKIVFPQMSDPQSGAFPWLWLHAAQGTFAPGAMVAGLTESLQASIQTATNFRPSSGGGRGGGFSGGGGFGGGGGGGRAG